MMGFENHPDNISPVQVLKNRKLQIDKYIQRMTKNGVCGEFFNYYVSQSDSFNYAILLLERHEEETRRRS